MPPYPVDIAYDLSRDELRLRVGAVRFRRVDDRIHSVRSLGAAHAVVYDVILRPTAVAAARVHELVMRIVLAAEFLCHQPRKHLVYELDDRARRAMIVVEPQMRISARRRRLALAHKTFGRAPPKPVYRLLDVADEEQLRAERREAVRYRVLQRIDVLILVDEHVPHRRGDLRAAAVVGEHAARAVFEVGIIYLAERGFFRIEQIERDTRGAAERGGITRTFHLPRARKFTELRSQFSAVVFQLFERVVYLGLCRDVAVVVFRRVPRRGERVYLTVEVIKNLAGDSRHGVQPDLLGARSYFFAAPHKPRAPPVRHAVELGKVLAVGLVRGQIPVGIVGRKSMIDYALDGLRRALAAPRRQHAEHNGKLRIVRKLLYRRLDARCLYRLRLRLVGERRGGIEPCGVVVRTH